ncbi:MAG: hypothetical protein Q4B70_01030 [Lachnospiraceae bacterium]|nr:hypothetical protein [Lachnospiraceae bacterium]
MDIKKEIKLTATTSAEDGTIIATYQGSVDTTNPKKISYNPYIADQELYRLNRTKVKEDQMAFEDALYSEQDKMLLAQEGTEE